VAGPPDPHVTPGHHPGRLIRAHPCPGNRHQAWPRQEPGRSPLLSSPPAMTATGTEWNQSPPGMGAMGRRLPPGAVTKFQH
jgi:hypothetical protein